MFSSDFGRVEVIDIFGRDGAHKNLPSKIRVIPSVSITEDDPLPNYICVQCIDKLDAILAFQEQCKQAQKVLWKEFIVSCCERATKLRKGKDVRVRAQLCRETELLVHRAVTNGVGVDKLQKCLWQDLGHLCDQRPAACPDMLTQLGSLPWVRLERCPSPPVHSTPCQEIEDALPVFCITKNTSGENEVLWVRGDGDGGRICDVTGDETRVDEVASGEDVQVANKNLVTNCDKKKSRESVKQSSSHSKLSCADILDLASSEVREDISGSPRSEDVDTIGSKIEVTEFVDVGVFNDETVKVNNEVKIKEEEEPLLEFIDPGSLFRGRVEGGVDKPLKKTMETRSQTDAVGMIASPQQSLVDTVLIKQESLPLNNLLDMVVSYNHANSGGKTPTIKPRVLAQQDSCSTTAQPVPADRTKLLELVSQAKQSVLYRNAACQTSGTQAQANAHQRARDRPGDNVQGVPVPVSQAESLRYVYLGNIQPSQATSAAHNSRDNPPPAPRSVRQLPVSRVQPLTTQAHAPSEKNSQASQNLEVMFQRARTPIINKMPPNWMNSSKPVAQSDSVGAQNVALFSHTAKNSKLVVEMQQTATNREAVSSILHPSTSFQHFINNSQPAFSVVNHPSLANVQGISSIRQPIESTQHVTNTAQPAITARTLSSHNNKNVQSIPSIHFSTATSFEPVISNSQSTISIVNHPLLSNVKAVHNVEPLNTTTFQHVSNLQPRPAISVVNRPLLTNVQTVPSIQNPITTSFHQAISNSQPEITVLPKSVQTVQNSQPVISFQDVTSNSRPVNSFIDHSSLANVQPVPSIQHPNSSNHHVVSNSQPLVSVINFPSQTFPCVQLPTSASLQQVSSSKPVISVKDFSRMQIDPVGQNRCSEYKTQPAPEQGSRPNSMKRALDVTKGENPKQPKLIGLPTPNQLQAQLMSVVDWHAPVKGQAIRPYSLKMKDWDKMRDESSGLEAPPESAKGESVLESPCAGNSYKEYLQVRDNKFVCMLCEGVTESKEVCEAHIANHRKDSHFYCLTCSVEVPALRFVKSHLQHRPAAETQDKWFRCVVCKVAFSREVSLRYHFRRHAVPGCDKYSYLCQPCGKAFVLRADYLTHTMQVHGAEEGMPGIACKRCGVLFYSGSALDRHLAGLCGGQAADDDCLIID
ncbi:uncharacterized protein LOC134530579 isoform X2 [Bacillus rossius redtenbacheri]|uniref:uncharacterized protein LOC134530579 isoform X2 n=1 Tax=Bacillus rossius redtenbacheri TaxID=93214 RepID=UPI002FDED3B3